MEGIERLIENEKNSSKKREKRTLDNSNSAYSAAQGQKKPLRKKRSHSESSSGSNAATASQDLIMTAESAPQAPSSSKRNKAKKDENISKTFAHFIEETLQRLLESEKISPATCEEIRSVLVSKNLSSESVSTDLTSELIRVCKIEYEEIQSNSDRLCGFGWSKSKVASHMKRCLQDKIDLAMDVIQDFINKSYVTLESNGFPRRLASVDNLV